MRFLSHWVLAVFLMGVAAGQQQTDSRSREGVGAVSGHITCSDTQLPARMASVAIVPVTEAASPGSKTEKTAQKREINTTIGQTLLDGSFLITDVRPGRYYVVAEKAGYLSPIAQFSRADLNHPTKAQAELMASSLVTVNVSANHMSRAEVSLIHGAAIAGWVKFDDGTVVAGAPVRLLVKDATNNWVKFRGQLLNQWFESASTDDQGHYRIGGLPAGEYQAQVSLQVNEILVDHIFREDGSSAYNKEYSLNVYFGDVVRGRDAKTIKVVDGEESPNNLIVVPLSKLHAVSGTLAEAGSGDLVNAGHVAIVDPEDDSELVSTDVAKEDDSFHFLYVPEGEYTVKVTNARDITRKDVPTCEGCMPPTRTEETELNKFGDGKQSLIVHGDVTGLVISIPPKRENVPSQ
jgi:hypothetical protein